MRYFNEINIRCYCKKNDAMVYTDMGGPGNWYDEPKGGRVVEGRLFKHEKTYLSKPMLWTTSTDMNNEYLYEGDIIQDIEGNLLGLVQFNDLGNSFIVQKKGVVFNLDNINSLGRMLQCFIIGNVYQDNDLLYKCDPSLWRV